MGFRLNLSNPRVGVSDSNVLIKDITNKNNSNEGESHSRDFDVRSLEPGDILLFGLHPQAGWSGYGVSIVQMNNDYFYKNGHSSTTHAGIVISIDKEKGTVRYAHIKDGQTYQRDEVTLFDRTTFVYRVKDRQVAEIAAKLADDDKYKNIRWNLLVGVVCTFFPSRVKYNGNPHHINRYSICSLFVIQIYKKAFALFYPGQEDLYMRINSYNRVAPLQHYFFGNSNFSHYLIPQLRNELFNVIKNKIEERMKNDNLSKIKPAYDMALAQIMELTNSINNVEKTTFLLSSIMPQLKDIASQDSSYLSFYDFLVGFAISQGIFPRDYGIEQPKILDRRFIQWKCSL